MMYDDDLMDVSDDECMGEATPKLKAVPTA
jgi:hypothetical protein